MECIGYSNIVPLSELRERLKTTFAFWFIKSVLSIYLLGSGQHSLNGKVGGLLKDLRNAF